MILQQIFEFELHNIVQNNTSISNNDLQIKIIYNKLVKLIIICIKIEKPT